MNFKNCDNKKAIEIFENEKFEDVKFIGFSRICGNPIFNLNNDIVFRRRIKLEKLENGKYSRNLFLNNKKSLKESFYDFFKKYDITICNIDLISTIKTL